MTKTGATSSGNLADYSQIYSPEGLFLRYAKGRVKYFVARLAFIMAAGFLLLGLVPLKAGLLSVSLIILGEIVDCLFLHQAPKMLQQGRPLHWLKFVSILTAVLQALPIAICAGLAWALRPDHGEPLFAIGVLTSAAINAGLILPFNRGAAKTKLAIYGLVPLVMVGVQFWITHDADHGVRMDLAGLAMLYTSLMWFINFVSKSFERNRDHVLAQVDQRQQLEVNNALLLEQQQQAQRLAMVAEHANDSVFLMGVDEHITWANDAFTRITGYSFSEAVGRRPRDLLNSMTTDPETATKLLEDRIKGVPCRTEIYVQRKDGQFIWLETSQVPVRGINGEVGTVVVIERDITKAREHAQELENARRSAEEGERTKTEFLATMSHEIRTPMNGVIGMAQLLEGTTLDTDQRLYTDTILSSSRTLLALINDVLDLSKLDADKVSFSLVDFDIRTCFEETLHLLQVQAQQKDILLILDVLGEVPHLVHGDDVRIRQILLNLVGNAIKFTELGEVRVTLSVKEGRNGLLLVFAVKDTGIGIPADKLDHVFERFSQAESATTRRFGGTGLGLTISRKLANAMGGEITVSSKQGKGSSFFVTLELGTVQEQDIPQKIPTETEVPIALPRAGMRILVAEDNKVNRLVMRKFLRDVPVELEFAHNGKDAVAMVETMKPDLVFMDMSMPLMNGIDATLAIRGNGKEQPVIVALTANAFDSDRTACLQAGMDEFLRKPLNRSEVLAVLRRHDNSDQVLTGS